MSAHMMDTVSTQRLVRDTIGRIVQSDAGHEGREVDVGSLAQPSYKSPG